MYSEEDDDIPMTQFKSHGDEISNFDTNSNINDQHQQQQNGYNNIYSMTPDNQSEDGQGGVPRIVHINGGDYNDKFKFEKNEIATTRFSGVSRIPRIILEQLMRLINVYFIIISVISFIPDVSPTGRFTTLGPFLVTLLISVAREIIEDKKRQKQDEAVNYGTCEALRNGQFVQTLWKNIRVGEIVKIRNRQYIPADLYLFSSSEQDNSCWIETKNLDGESNLKQKQASNQMVFLKDNIELLNDFNGLIECNSPSKDLNYLKGILFFGENYVILNNKQFLLRGTKLRNTEWINGIVLYSGKDTKIMQNSGTPKTKKSHIENLTNHFIIFVFFIQIVLCAGSALGNGIWSTNHNGWWYLQFTRNGAVEGGISFLTFLVLYNNIIPISFYATIEIVRLAQTWFINNDIEMYHQETDSPALVKTANLNEQLGQIEYIFTDKTGTLTQNKMSFKKCLIGGTVYGESIPSNTNLDEANTMPSPRSRNPNNLEMMSLEIPENGASNGQVGQSTSYNPSSSTGQQSSQLPYVNFNDGGKLIDDLNSRTEQSELIKEFFYVLSICHSVIPQQEDGKTNYIASSPDENALVCAAKSFGFEFIHKTSKAVYLKQNGVDDLKFELLHVLEFSHERKRMSVIVRKPNGKLVLYCKGADSVIFDKLAPNQPNADTAIVHIQEFAYEGLRTLCVASTTLNEGVYQQWLSQYQAACSSTTLVESEKEREIERVAELIETDFQLLGVTGIEDKLQDGVIETIDLLKQAGIKIWIQTGDGQDNAINIGYSCGLITSEHEMIVINERTKENAIAELNRHVTEQTSLESRNDENKKLVLVIDGQTLKFVLDDHVGYTFLRLAKLCEAVICCRVSPFQKSKIVKLVRKTFSPITLAIGDGANDVMMIQVAHVGVGINGQEGKQAAYASDYTISQFRHLSTLLLVHGHHSYRRMSKLICFIFYKGIVLYFAQFLFAIFNGFSGQTLFETYNLTGYTIVFTFFPLIVYCILEKEVNEKTLFQYPQLYKAGIENKHFNHFTFLQWILNGFYHSFIAFAIPYCVIFKSNAFSHGQTQELFAFGLIVYCCVMLVVTGKLALETHHWTWVNHLAMWGSLIVYFIWQIIYAKINTSEVGSDLFGSMFHIGESAHFYFLLLFVPVIALWRDFTWKFMYRQFMPDSSHIAQEIQRKVNNQSMDSHSLDKKYLSNQHHKNTVQRTTSSYSFSQEQSNTSPKQKQQSI